MQKKFKNTVGRSRRSIHRVVLSAAVLLLTNAASVGAQTIDTTPSWNGTSSIGSWGVVNTATYGQTITATSQTTTLNSFSFYLQGASGADAQCRAYIYAWDGTKATGSAIYASGVMTIANVNSFTQVTVNTGGVALSGNQQYVVLLTTSNEQPGQANSAFRWGSVSDSVYLGGSFVFLNNGNDISQLTTSSWSNWISSDLAFVMVFAPTATEAVTYVGNNNALSAAGVIDSHSVLSNCFSGVSASSGTYGKAVSQTLPLLTGNSVSIAQSTFGRVSSIIQARQAEVRGVSVPNNTFGEVNSLMQTRQSTAKDLSYNNRFFSSVNNLTQALQSKVLGVSSDGTGFSDKNFWVKTFGSWADQNDSGGIAGYSANTAGVVLGFDTPVSDKRRQGLALSYARSDVDGNSVEAPQNADIDVYQLIGYGDTQLSKDVDFNYQIGIGQNSTKGHRTVSFLSGVADASYHSPTFTAGMGLERTVKLNEKTQFSPSVRLDYSSIHDRSYQETGSASIDPLLLHVDSHTAQELVLGLDAKLSRQCNSSTNVSVNAGVGYDMLNERNSITSTYAGASDAAFVTNGLEKSPWLGRVGLGLIHNTKNGTEVNVRCDSDFRHGYVNNSASVKLSWKF